MDIRIPRMGRDYTKNSTVVDAVVRAMIDGGYDLEDIIGAWHEITQLRLEEEIIAKRSCPDCGERGEQRGHQTCQYPESEET